MPDGTARAPRKLQVPELDKRQYEEILKYASEIRKFEIGLFWQRSLFFWGFLAAAFLAYSNLAKDRAENQGLLLVIACFGLICSVAWTLQNRGSKYWQEAWEQKVVAVEEKALGCDLFSNIEPMQPKRPRIWQGRRFSVSCLTIALSDFSVAVWSTLAGSAFVDVERYDNAFSRLAVLMVVLAYALWMGTNAWRPDRELVDEKN